MHFSNFMIRTLFQHSKIIQSTPNLPLFDTTNHQAIITISLMAMEAAIQTITYSIHLNFILQNIDFLSLKIEKDVVSITDSPPAMLNCLVCCTML